MENPDDSGRWLFHRRLGAGAFGVVELWRNDYTEAMIAIKKCRGGSDQLTQRQRERWINEVQTMNLLQHPNIVATRRVPSQLQELDGPVSVLCMEYCSRGDLRTVLNESKNCCGIKEKEALKIMQHISSAVEYLHSQKLIHRDLKPENIVLQGSKETTVYKLTDLGYVRELGEMSANASVVGTLNYLAPELLMKPKYNCSVDYWSLGILFYEIITGTRPFLPNLPITVKWMEHVSRKRYEDICARDEGGRVAFSAEIESPSTISDCMRHPLTTWFRIALQWDPKKRGKVTNNVGEHELVVFSMLKSILNWKILRVFVVSQYRVDSYAVFPNINVQDLQSIIRQRTGIDVTHQILTDRMGTVLNEANSPVLKCTEDSFLIVFQRDSLRVENPPAPNMYSSLQRMMENPRNTLDNDTTRRYYSTALFFLKQEFDLFRSYVIALSIKIDLSNMGFESVRGIVQTLTTITNNLMSEIMAYAQSYEYGLMSDELRESLTTTAAKTQKLLEGTQEVSSKLDALSADSDELKRFSEINWLERWTPLYEKARVILETSARGTRGQRGSPVLMVKLLYEALKLRVDQLRSPEILSIVSHITNYDRNILQIQESLNSFQVLVDLYRKNYQEILAKQAIEAETSCYALIDSMTPNDSLIYDNIVIRRIIEELNDAMQGKVMDIGEL